MGLSRRNAQIARNEASFRDINERLEEGLRQVRHAPQLQEFVCECGDRSCDQLVRLTFPEYEAVRVDLRRFAVVPGHVAADAERVVDWNPRYEVVEKFREAEEITDAADHRAPSRAGRRSAEATP